MPFDGVVTKCLVNELKNNILTGRIDKIHQPERDEININLRAKGKNLKLLLSANSIYARIHLTSIVKQNPIKAPLFCMILRKHLIGARIFDIDFLDYERIIKISFENTTELGELSLKYLIIEIMGRHSNIVLVNNNYKIIDSIKHIDFEISSKREVMPARDYVLPPNQDKISPESDNLMSIFDDDHIKNISSNISVSKYLLNNIKGFSPIICNEICLNSNIDIKDSLTTISLQQLDNLKSNIQKIQLSLKASSFKPCIIYQPGTKIPMDYHCLDIFNLNNIQNFNYISEVLDFFYEEKDKLAYLKQKKAHLLKLLNNNISRCCKKITIHEDILVKASKNNELKLFGELITANIHNIPKNSPKVSLQNYYSENLEYIEISLNPNLNPQVNAQKYFKRYNKAKKSILESSKQLALANSELLYLESIMQSLTIASSINEINEIQEELISQNYLIDKSKKKKVHQKPSKPLHFKSSDGFDIFVGKNNLQNDFLTLKSSSANDIWLHTKDIHGSHVIIKMKDKKELPDKTLEEAAILSAFFSKAQMSANVPVDYTNVKNVKKPSGAKPGMVIYVNHKTIYVNPDEKIVNQLRNT